MSSSETLKEIYIDEMRDLWSANDQMQRVMKTLSAKASDKKLKDLLEKSVAGIGKHTETLKSVLDAQGGRPHREHCKGMEGLVTEALKHGVKEAPVAGELRDIAIITQYQRMSHYGITGFGSVAALADALGKREQVATLKRIVADIYKADEYSSHLGEAAAKLAARGAP